jgi:peptidoglycan DL-endopeptidase LytF
MSRRDTIIIAVLINAGLLVVLFSTALKSNHPQEIISTSSSTSTQNVADFAFREPPPAVATAAAPSSASGDEIDQVIRQFSQSIPESANIPNIQQQPVSVIEPEKSEAKKEFIQDLTAITLPEVPITSFQAEQPVRSTKAASENAPIEVVVKKGDVLDKIARTHGTSVEEIMRLNQLRSTRLKIGQVLKVSPSGAKKTEKHDTTIKYYTVKAGDNPWTIAVKNHMKVEELLKLNQLDQEKARHLKPGDQLRIR